MKFLSGEKVKNFMEDIICEKKQVHKHCVDLTVKKIYRLRSGASLDFGGSEYKAADKKPLKPVKTGKEDKYGWWKLTPGSYIFRYNELLTLAPGQKAVIQMHPRVSESGVCHTSCIKEESGEILMHVIVADETCLKENARVSEVRIMEE